MKDPFEEFLEDAMSGPDLELGHESRRRLLEAAVAGDAAPAGNVVRMGRADGDEQAGFDWLLGESPASKPLVSRMIRDAGFLASLDQDRSFLRMLRLALRKHAATAAPASRGRILPATVMSAAAAFALVAAAVFFTRSGNDPAPATLAGENAGQPASGVPSMSRSDGAAALPDPAAIVAAESNVEQGAADDTAPGPEFFLPPDMEAGDAPSVAMLGGSGRSISPPSPSVDGGASEASGAGLLALAGRRSVQDDPGMTLLDEGPDPVVASFSDHGLMLDAGSMRGMAWGTGPAASLTMGEDRGSIPEPAAPLVFLIGMMGSLLRRRRRPCDPPRSQADT